MAANIEDVARLAGVARGTVSNVMNRPEIVSPKTIEKVRAAMLKLDFVPNESARVLAGGSSRFIGVVVHDAANPFFAEIARSVEDLALGRMYTVAITSTGADSQREGNALELLLQQRAKGVLLTPAAMNALGVARLRSSGTSVVLLDSQGTRDECSVSVDDGHGGRLAGEHLASLGRRRYVFVGTATRTVQHAERLAGFREAIAASGGADMVETVEVALEDVASGRSAAGDVARLAADEPISVFCGNDLIAVGLMFGLQERGVRIPQDVALCGYDDIDLAQYLATPLTSVRQPMREIGARAFELLLDEMSGSGHEHRQVVFEPGLEVRASTGS